MSMAGPPIRPVGPFCHGFRRVMCFYVGVNDIKIDRQEQVATPVRTGLASDKGFRNQKKFEQYPAGAGVLYGCPEEHR